MSLLDDYYKAKKKREEEEKRGIVPSYSTRSPFDDVRRYESYIDDIPIKSLNKDEEEQTEKSDTTQKSLRKEGNLRNKLDELPNKKAAQNQGKLDFFQKGDFEDGFDWSDIPASILGTAGDAALGVAKGAGRLVEGVADLAIYGMAGIADKAGNEEWADRRRKIAQNSIVDNLTSGADEYLNQYSVLGRTSDSIAEGIGQVATIMLTGGAAGAAGLGTVGTTAVTTGLMGVSGVGSGMSEAYQGGATDEEALTYGLISGTADAVSELIFGGLGKSVNATGLSTGLSSADDLLAQKLTKNVTNTLTKNLIQLGVKSAAEGLEEVLAGTAQAVGKKLTYMSEEDLLTIIKDENLLEQFVVGALTSSIAQAGDVVKHTKRGESLVTGLTADEETVYNKVYEELVAAEEKDGKKISGSRKKAIYDRVQNMMDKGYITAEKIEEILGGDSYNAYRTEVDNFFGSEEYKAYKKAEADEKKLREEFEPLAEMVENTMTGNQIYRRNDLKKMLDESKLGEMRKGLTVGASKVNEMRSKMRSEVMNRVSGSKLAESYRELARKSEKFTADVTKYTDENAKKTVQSILDSGVGDNTTQFHEFVDFIARISTDKGIVFDMTNNESLKGTEHYKEGYITNGFVSDDGKITINWDSPKALNTIVGHEITHTLEKCGAFGNLRDALFDYAITKEGKDAFNTRIKDAEEAYKGMKNTTPEAEVAADLIGEYLFTDADFVQHLSKTNHKGFMKMFDDIKYLCRVVTAGSKEAAQLEKVKREFQKAYNENVKGKTETSTGDKLSIQKNIVDVNGKEYDTVVELDKVVSKKTLSEPRKLLAYIEKNLVGLEIPVIDASGNVEVIEFAGAKETTSKNGKPHPVLGKLAYTKGDTRRRVIVNAEEVIRVSEYDPVYSSTENEHGWLDKNGWESRKTYVLTQDGMIYEAYLRIAKAQDGRNILYAVNLDINNGIAVDRSATQKRAAVLAAMPSGEMVAQNNPDVKHSFSSIANSFFGKEDMSTSEFLEDDYHETQGYKDYVNQCLDNMRQSRAEFDEDFAKAAIQNSIDGIVRVAVAAKQAGYDIADSADRRNVRDSKKRLLFSSLEPNSDYFTSNDISTICDKRKNFAEIYDEIVRMEEAKGVPKGKRFFDNVDNYFAIHKIMAVKGLTTPCRQCYVESMRKNLAPMATAFLELVGEKNPDNTANPQLFHQKGKNKGVQKTSNASVREFVISTFEEHPEYNMSVDDLTVEMLTTEDGLAQLRIQAPLVYEAFNSFYGQAKPKMPKSATPFRFGELTALLTDNKGRIKKSLVDKINSTGGFRLQSYSDFQIQNYVDVLQVLFEAGTLGLNGHAYTKVPAFLDATEGTNLKRNISIFMYKDGGEWKLDRNDSFPDSLEDIYKRVQDDKTGNTSIIAVSQNADMSAWIMANDYVGYGIPFHKSGLKMGTVRDTVVRTEDGREVRGYSETKDHTKQQTEVWARTTADHKANTKVSKGINIYSFWDFENKGNLSKRDLIVKNVKAYIDQCEELGYLPKFREYVMNNGSVLNNVLKYAKELGFVSAGATISDISFEYKGYRIPYGYYKFLGDFGMFTPDGKAAPQQPLSLEGYDFDKAVDFFSDAESLRRNEILQQFANGKKREEYRASKMTAEELEQVAKQKRTEVAKEATKYSMSKEGNYGYHAGDLGKAEGYWNMMSSNRGTGHFGTGTYFVGDEAQIGDDYYGKRPHEKVDFSDYHLFRPLYEDEGHKLHSALKYINDNIHDYPIAAMTFDERWDVREKIEDAEYTLWDEDATEDDKAAARQTLEDFKVQFESVGYDPDEMSSDELYEKLKDIHNDYRAYRSKLGLIFSRDMRDLSYDAANEKIDSVMQGIYDEVSQIGDSYAARYEDSPSTRFMKAMGYEGIDVRGFKGLDNTTYGSVIYDLKGEDLARKQEIGTARYSLSKETDNAYMDAITNGDSESVERFVEEAATLAGYDKRMFHETDAENIHIFDISRGTHGGKDYETPCGIFTKSTSKNIGLGSRQMQLFVKAHNTLQVENRADVVNKIPGFVEYYDQITEIDKKYDALANELEDEEFDALMAWMEEHPDADMDEVFPNSYIIENKPADIDSEEYLAAHKKRVDVMTEWSEAYDAVAVKAKAYITEYLRSNGYDSMYFVIDGGSRGRQTDSLIVLDENQVKSADPITYDDNGNIIPLSERFNAEEKDTRYSMSKEGEDLPIRGNYNVYSNEFGEKTDALDEFDIPIREEQTTAPTSAETDANPFMDDEEYLEQVNSITDEDAPPERPKARPTEDSRMDSIDAKISEKHKGLVTELEENQRLQAESRTHFDEEIAELQAEYDAKKNKNTATANDILRRIERLKRMRDSVDADYTKRIERLGERIDKVSKKEYSTAEHRRAKMQEHNDFWESLLGDTSTWKDLPMGIMYKTKTMRRFLRKVVRGADGKPDIAKADAIYDALETKYDHHEAQLKRESGELKEVFKKLNLNHHEDTYAHMLGELRHNPQTTLTEDVVNEYYNKHKKSIDAHKVDYAIKESRKLFDDLIVRVNKVLREQGFKEIPYRQGYFPHFENPKQNWLMKLFNWKPVNNDIPTDIAGLTETFNPQRSWQGFDKQRKSDTTDYSLYQGLDTYIHGALDWIYHIDDLQSRRALENYIRYVHSDEGVKARIEEIKANDSYDADQTQEMIEAVLAEAKNPLNNLVTELRARTNTLANKKSSMDRGMEEATNRKVYSTMTNLNNRINANMVVGSLSSALTNFIPMVQSWHQVSPVNTVRGLFGTIKSSIRDDGMVENSDFLTNRLIEEEKLYKTGWDKASDKAAFMMNIIDNITSQTVWRSKYLQNMDEGMSYAEAVMDADQFAKNLMAGRSRGNAPSIFDAKNPLIKIFTSFQLEVANQYGYMFEDVPQDSKNTGRLIKGYATAFLGAYVYNALYSSLVGRDAAFDPIAIFEDLFRDMGLFGDDDDEEKEPEDIALNLVDNILEEVPYVGSLVGGGRIPMSSAMPYDGDYKTFVADIANGEVKVKEMLKPLYYLALPFGGGQIKKINEGLAMFDDDLPVTGSYTGSGALRYPVEDTIPNRIQAGLFGQYANENARDYFDNGRTPLQEKQIQEYKDLDIPIRDYWDIRDGLKGRNTLGEKLAYISDLDLPIRKQNILANNAADRDEPIDMTDWDKYDGLEEFDYAKKYPEKEKFLEANGISVKEFNKFDDETKDAYNWAYQNPEKYAVSKAVTDDLVEYKKYTKALNDIRADKDANGKAIAGSAKNKKVEYINGLNLDYGAKLVLFKSIYPGDDTYNYEIIDYLNNNSKYTFEDKRTILEELGFTVLDDGSVRWN